MGMDVTTEGISPKAVAAAVAALVSPILADLVGVDQALLLAAITAVLTLAAAYLAPPGRTSIPVDPDLDDPGLPSDVAVPTLTEPPSPSAAAHSHLEG